MLKSSTEVQLIVKCGAKSYYVELPTTIFDAKHVNRFDAVKNPFGRLSNVFKSHKQMACAAPSSENLYIKYTNHCTIKCRKIEHFSHQRRTDTLLQFNAHICIRLRNTIE